MAVIRLLLHNALRVDEACAADVADLCADAGHRVLRVTRKGARKAKIPLTPAAGSALDRVTKTTVFITDFAEFGAMNEVYGERLGTHRPARSTVQIAEQARHGGSGSGTSTPCATNSLTFLVYTEHARLALVLKDDDDHVVESRHRLARARRPA